MDYINKYPILIKPELYQVIGTDSDLFWLINKLINRMDIIKKTCFPSNETLSKDTGFSITKLKEVKKRGVDLGLFTITHRAKENGGQTSNLYEVTTDLIGLLKFETFTSSPPSQNPTPPQSESDHEHNITINTTTTTNRKLENFELDEQRKKILTMKGFDLNLYELELLNWKDYIKSLGSPPTNLTSSFTNWCLNSVSQHVKTNKAIQKTKTKEEIYQENQVDTGEVGVSIWQEEGESVEEFESRVEQRKKITGSKYKKHYLKNNSYFL